MRAVRFIYWNTGQQPGTQEAVLDAILGPLAAVGTALDVLLLGECTVALGEDFLRRHQLTRLPFSQGETKTLTQQVYFRKDSGLDISHLSSGVVVDEDPLVLPAGVNASDVLVPNIARVVLLQIAIGQELTLLACVHMPSRRHGYQDEASQLTLAGIYKQFIMQAGGKPLATFGQRIIITGDFNMNPFDLGMLQPTGFYAINNRRYVRQTRSISNVPHAMFYNPCWALLGDADPVLLSATKPSGSLFFEGAASKRLWWHLYDQVLLSERLSDRLIGPELRIVPCKLLQDEVESDVMRKDAQYSDHLPLQFSLNLGR